MQDANKIVTQKKGRVGRANSGHSGASLNISTIGVAINTNELGSEQDEEVDENFYHAPF